VIAEKKILLRKETEKIGVVNFFNVRENLEYIIRFGRETFKERHLLRLKVIFSSASKRTRPKRRLVFRALGYRPPVVETTLFIFFTTSLSAGCFFILCVCREVSPAVVWSSWACYEDLRGPHESKSDCSDSLFRVGRYYDWSSRVLCVQKLSTRARIDPIWKTTTEFLSRSAQRFYVLCFWSRSPDDLM